jgi:hypothetical protein
MKALRALLADRRRSQRGSVLSAVLIIVAFLAIISGALMTELSTNFLLTNHLVNRVATEATVNSAMELAVDKLQNTQLIKGCPGVLPATSLPAPITLNGRTAVVSYADCWPTVDVRSPRYRSVASPASFNIDGTHSVISGVVGQDLYVVGDSAGRVYSYQFGQSSPIWSTDLQSTITGPPLAMQDAACRSSGQCPDTGDPVTGRNADVTYLVPIAGGGASDCQANACVVLLGQDVPNPPDVTCYLAANANVTSRPAAGMAFPTLTYFGDSGGTLYAYDATEFACSNGSPTPLASLAAPGIAIVAGPLVFRNNNRDEIYVVTSDGSTNQLREYTYKQGGQALSLTETLPLPYANQTPVGVAVEQASVPARVAITFAGGGVAIAHIDTNYNLSLLAAAGLATGIEGSPFWCSCPGGQQVGVAGDNGKLYVLDTNLNIVASYAAGSPIRTTPASDLVGEWFFGTDDGYLHEVQQTPGQSSLVEVALYGPPGGLGRVGSSVQVAGCPAGICIYLGTSSNAYLVSLNARDAKITACLSDTPPACSGDNPRLWAKVEVGSSGAPKTVHVQGWSYYSP